LSGHRLTKRSAERLWFRRSSPNASKTICLLPLELITQKSPEGDFANQAPRVGLEPTTNSLTGSCSTIELPRNIVRLNANVKKYSEIYEAWKGGYNHGVRTAYTILGILFILVFGVAAYVLSPSSSPLPQSSSTLSTTTPNSSLPMQISSTAFRDGESIPSKYTCDGDNISPPLAITDVPPSAKSLALIVEDRDVPRAVKEDGVFDHWVLFNIPASTTEVGQGMSAGTEGSNGSGKTGYTGPCPPPQYEPQEHRYHFMIYALDEVLPLNAGASKEALEIAMKGHVVEQTELLGRYQRI
jgi:Raf kinase inhibitor-like YbhB/YbcL family protein